MQTEISPKALPRQHHNKKEATREILKPIIELSHGRVYMILILAIISTMGIIFVILLNDLIF